jgi:hypothetical protein
MGSPGRIVRGRETSLDFKGLRKRLWIPGRPSSRQLVQQNFARVLR